MKRLLRCSTDVDIPFAEFQPLILTKSDEPVVLFHSSPKPIERFDLSLSTQIGLHCGGFIQALKIHIGRLRSSKEPRLYKVTLQSPYKILDLDWDVKEYHRPIVVAFQLNHDGLIDDTTYDNLRNAINSVYSDEAKSQIVNRYMRQFCSAFRYPNTTEQKGYSICIIDNIVSKIEDITDTPVPDELYQQALLK